MFYTKLSQRLYLGLKVLDANAGCQFQIEYLLVFQDGNRDLEPNWYRVLWIKEKDQNPTSLYINIFH